MKTLSVLEKILWTAIIWYAVHFGWGFLTEGYNYLFGSVHHTNQDLELAMKIWIIFIWLIMVIMAVALGEIQKIIKQMREDMWKYRKQQQ